MPQLTPPLSLKSAIREIKQSYEFAVRKERASPYFFVIGAGLSVPQVPLAQEIIRDCKKRSGATEAPSSGSSILDEYSRYLDEAFPAPVERQDYFQNLIRGKSIPAANFRLAHLLLGEQGRTPLASLVITTNFDDFLTRALQLFGKEHVLCDSPSTAPRLVLSNADRLQIVHVHGTYYFYDIKNLSGEVEATAAASEETTATMGSLLDAVLRDQSPIVVGYGGWDGDVFMKSLRRRLRGGTLPQPLYWCCYRRNDWQTLPDWLRTHSSVRFVEPEKSAGTAGMSGHPGEQAAGSGAIPGMAASLLDETRGTEMVLDARSVFDELIQALDLRPPELTQNPIEFFADQLDRSLPRDDAIQGTDLYRIKSTIGEMRAAAKWILDYRQQRTATEQQLDAVRERLRGAKYADAMPLVTDIHVKDLNEDERGDLWDMAWEIVNSQQFLDQLSAQTLAMLDQFDRIAALVPACEESARRVATGRLRRGLNLVTLGRTDEGGKLLVDHVELSRRSSDPEIRVPAAELLLQLAWQGLSPPSEASVKLFDLLLLWFQEPDDERLRDVQARGLLGKGLLFVAMGKKPDAVDAWGTLLTRFSAGTSTLTPERIAQVTVLQGATLGDLGRFEDSIAAYDEVVRRFGEATEPGIREQVASALVNKGIAQGKLTSPADEVAVYDEVVRRFGEATEPGIREQVARALVNKGVAQGNLTTPADQVAVYDEVVRRFGEATEPGIREQVARALFNKGIAQGKLTSPADEVAVYDEVVRRFGEATEPGIREMVARALVNKGVEQGNLTTPADQVAVYDEVVRRFGEATEPGIREMVARALLNKGVAQGNLTTPADQVAVYDEVVRRFGEATEPGIREQVARALFNKGAAQGKLTTPADEVAVYDEVVQRFGEATEPGIREQVAKALVDKGIAQGKLTSPADEVAVYDEVVRRFGEATEPGIREQVAKALFNKGIAQGSLTIPADEVAVYDEVVRRFGEATEPGIREVVARALLNKGIAQGKLTSPADEVAVYDEVVRRFGEATEPGIREMVAKALLNKGIAQGKLTSPADEVAVYDEVVQRFGEATEPGIREQVAKALVSKGAAQGKLTSPADEVAVYDEVVQRFGEATEPGIREMVGNALNGIAFNLLCEAKATWKRESRERASEELRQAAERAERALLYLPSNPVVLGNKGYALFLAGETEAGAAALREAIKLGGEDIRHGELADADINPVPLDEAFKELVRSIPAAG